MAQGCRWHNTHTSLTELSCIVGNTVICRGRRIYAGNKNAKQISHQVDITGAMNRIHSVFEKTISPLTLFSLMQKSQRRTSQNLSAQTSTIIRLFACLDMTSGTFRWTEENEMHPHLNICFSLSAELSLDHFAMRRFYNDKLSALMTPSQKR